MAVCSTPLGTAKMEEERATEVSQQLKSHFLLPFHKAIISSLVPKGSSVDWQDDETGRRIERQETEDQEDGNALIIMARGLGLRRIVSTVMKIYDAPTNLVILVNATSEEEEGISEELTTLGVRRPGLRTISHEMNIAKRRVTSRAIGHDLITDPRHWSRQELYLSGGLLSITSRILIVDMLLKRIPTDLITGLLIMHAEQ